MPDEACATHEPAIAAMIDGTLDADASPGLVEHLTRCAICNEVAAAVSLVREDIRALPEPVPLAGVHEPNRDTSFPSWLVPSTMWARAVQLALVAALFLLIGYWLAPANRSAVVHVAPDPSLADPDVPRAGSGAVVLPDGELSVGLPQPAPPVVIVQHDPEVAPKPGRVSVACSPACDRILIDGVSVGPSPLERHRVRAGAHDFTFIRGNERQNKRIVVKEGTIVPIRVTMTEQTSEDGFGHVQVRCSPACERIYIDGKNVGPSPLQRHRVSAGTHDFVFVRGKDRKTKRLVLKARTIVPIHVMMSDAEDTVR